MTPEPVLPTHPLVLVTGSTGYIGGRLVPELIAAGFRVRVGVGGAGEDVGAAAGLAVADVGVEAQGDRGVHGLPRGVRAVGWSTGCGYRRRRVG